MFKFSIYSAMILSGTLSLVLSNLGLHGYLNPLLAYPLAAVFLFAIWIIGWWATEYEKTYKHRARQRRLRKVILG